MSTHVEPLRAYLAVFALLMVGTALTVAVAFFDLGALNTPVALLIAGAKALAVILVFMHVRHQSKLVWLFVAAGFVWFLILISLTFVDSATRELPLLQWG